MMLKLCFPYISLSNLEIFTFIMLQYDYCIFIEFSCESIWLQV